MLNDCLEEDTHSLELPDETLIFGRGIVWNYLI